MNRRSFIKRAAMAVGAAAVGLQMLRAPKTSYADDHITHLRKLSKHHKTPIATLTRSIDGKSMDIYDAPDERVMEWAKGSNITAKLYDQSGNNNHPYEGPILL